MKTPELIIKTDGNTGVEIKAILDKEYHCVEYTTKADYPQTIFYSPFVQFEPQELTEIRTEIAWEIARKIANYEGLINRIKELEGRLNVNQNILSDRTDALHKACELWGKERAKNGLPQDFSDMKYEDWPIELLSIYRKKGRKTSKEIAERVISALNDRAGFNNFWGEVRKEDRKDIISEIAEIIETNK